MGTRQKRFVWLLPVIIVVLFAAAMLVPRLRESITYRWDAFRVQVKYLLNPPEKAVFIPADQQAEVARAVQATLNALTPSPTVTPSPTIELTPMPSPTPTVTPTPLPGRVKLEGIRYQSQRYMWNYCAPANLAMALSYWGWQGDRTTTGKWLKPFSEDKNVMPYEMVDYVEEEAGLKAVIRYGGDAQVLKDFIAAGFPVLLETGEVLHGEYGPGSTGWLGHYMVFSGYDDAAEAFIVQDSLVGADQEYLYGNLVTDWRSFNYVYIVIYPADREAEVFTLLGSQADEQANHEYAALKASNEVMGLEGRDRFFALFNRGSSLVELQDFGGAAMIFDEAFTLYPEIAVDERPYRMVWYNTSPYKAYYYSGLYWNVINLATTTLDAMAEGTLEESFYWRARAELALGDTAGAYKDLKQALKYHAGFTLAEQLLAEMGY